MAKTKIPERRRAKGWTAYQSYNKDSAIIRADGEFPPMGFTNDRPATKAEIEQEQARRDRAARKQAEIDAFRARPEYGDAESIRSTIEMMEYNNHPLDKLTPEEWRTLRITICERCACGIGDDLQSVSGHAVGCPMRIDD